MKSILMSIRPEWCKKIFDGEKTIEVRKTRPLIDMPFKVFMYETKAQFVKSIRGACTTFGYGRGKVIGSFVCDKIEKIDLQAQCTATLSERWTFNRIAKQACLTAEQLNEYLSGNNGYSWHITEPKLFDKPRELTFYKPCPKKWKNCPVCEFYSSYTGCCANRLTRPPQSWCYIEIDE